MSSAPATCLADTSSYRPADHCINTCFLFAGGTVCYMYQNGKRPLYSFQKKKKKGKTLSSNNSQWLLQRAALRVSCQRRSTHCIKGCLSSQFIWVWGQQQLLGRLTRNKDTSTPSLEQFAIQICLSAFPLSLHQKVHHRLLHHTHMQQKQKSTDNGFTLDQQCLCISADKCVQLLVYVKLQVSKFGDSKKLLIWNKCCPF